MINHVAVSVDGEIFKLPKPSLHTDIYASFGHLIGRDAIEGFVTDSGLFLNRKQAARHVIKTGQPTDSFDGATLFSQNLW